MNKIIFGMFSYKAHLKDWPMFSGPNKALSFKYRTKIHDHLKEKTYLYKSV